MTGLSHDQERPGHFPAGHTPFPKAGDGVRGFSAPLPPPCRVSPEGRRPAPLRRPRTHRNLLLFLVLLLRCRLHSGRSATALPSRRPPGGRRSAGTRPALLRMRGLRLANPPRCQGLPPPRACADTAFLRAPREAVGSAGVEGARGGVLARKVPGWERCGDGPVPPNRPPALGAAPPGRSGDGEALYVRSFSKECGGCGARRRVPCSLVPGRS